MTSLSFLVGFAIPVNHSVDCKELGILYTYIVELIWFHFENYLWWASCPKPHFCSRTCWHICLLNMWFQSLNILMTDIPNQGRFREVNDKPLENCHGFVDETTGVDKNNMLGGGFKFQILFSIFTPNLGWWSNLTCAFFLFKWVGSTKY